jgi:hypothetical protein
MTSTLEQRKAALAMSILPLHQRERVLESLPALQRSTIRLLLDWIFAQGWNDPSAIELALDFTARNPSAIAINSQELIRLSRLLGPELYARVLVGSDISDSGFLLALLERDYAALVQKALGEVPILPDRLKQSLLAAAHAQLADAKVQPCAV